LAFLALTPCSSLRVSIDHSTRGQSARLSIFCASHPIPRCTKSPTRNRHTACGGGLFGSSRRLVNVIHCAFLRLPSTITLYALLSVHEFVSFAIATLGPGRLLYRACIRSLRFLSICRSRCLWSYLISEASIQLHIMWAVSSAELNEAKRFEGLLPFLARFARSSCLLYGMEERPNLT
jgi:hypothetical protein